jgi:DNA helicase-2/ATP-dependent DNA helicase PcrA
MLVLGDAGYGKTTLALHRLAHLYHACKGRFRALLAVPTDGLERLIRPQLTRIGADVAVRRYERWARVEARRCFPKLPRRESTDATAAVLRLKRDPAVTAGLEILSRLPPGSIDDDPDQDAVEDEAQARRADLQHLFGDRLLVTRIVDASNGTVPRHAIDEVLDHTRVQFYQTTERSHSHVDKERLLTVDGLRIDRNTSTSDAGTIDAEDYAVLFELQRLRALRTGHAPTDPHAHDCLVVDEAQEFSELELRLLGRSLAPGATLVVAGDADQQVDPSLRFCGWERTLELLGRPKFDTIRLGTGFRCPPEVVAVAEAVRGSGVANMGASGLGAAFKGEAEFARWVDGELAKVREQDPAATTAILVRHPSGLRRLADRIETVVPIAHEGRFPKRGPVLAVVADVKGLEFDYVIVADADAKTYPMTPESRRTLYVAFTRTRHQLVVAHVGAPSPLVAGP